MNLDFTAEIYNEAVDNDLSLEIANKVLYQPGINAFTEPSAAASFDVELRRKHNYNKNYLLSYVQIFKYS